MGISIEILLYCDDGECAAPGAFNADSRLPTVSAVRKKAKAEGWTREKSNDYCPECSKRRKENVMRQRVKRG